MLITSLVYKVAVKAYLPLLHTTARLCHFIATLAVLVPNDAQNTCMAVKSNLQNAQLYLRTVVLNVHRNVKLL